MIFSSVITIALYLCATNISIASKGVFLMYEAGVSWTTRARQAAVMWRT